MDAATTRRGIPTANAVYGIGQSILFGDILLALGSEVVADLGKDEYRLFARTLRLVCDGQILETMEVGKVDRTQESYLSAISGKTAALLICATEIGASIAEFSPTAVETVREFARAFGMAFQIRDDILDLIGNGDQLGKPIGSDLGAGIVTLPVILAMESEPSLRHDVRHILGTETDFRGLVDRIIAIGAVNDAAQVAHRYADAAAKSLCELAPDDCDVNELLAALLPALPDSANAVN